MPLYKPSELMQFLHEIDASPKKRLSQNFLIDGNIIRKIVQTAHVQPGDIVLEIGPGPGVLTEACLEAGAHVIAVEKDTVLANALKRLNPEGDRLSVHTMDIMDFDVSQEVPKGKKVKVIANLPYHLTTPILAKLVENHALFSMIVVMVQDEVARRFTAKPHTSEYSSFTVFLDYYSTPHYAFSVSRHCFFPAPRVDSAVVKLVLKENSTFEDPSPFFKMTRTAFGHRRKMLRSSLRDLYGSEVVLAALKIMGKLETARPEEFSLQEFLLLFDALKRVQDIQK